VSTGTKEDGSSNGRVWAAGFHHVTARTRWASVLKLMNRLFLYFSEFLFSGRGKPRILNQQIRGHDYTYFIYFPIDYIEWYSKSLLYILNL
jgi:hypothetical protein